MDDYKILLIDTEENVIKALRRELRKEPYDIITANNVDRAMTIMEEQLIQVVISDIRLEGTTGSQIWRSIIWTGGTASTTSPTGTGTRRRVGACGFTTAAIT